MGLALSSHPCDTCVATARDLGDRYEKTVGRMSEVTGRPSAKFMAS